jgi:hypothetical protein
MDYLPGLLTLEYSLQRIRSRYPLVALYTDDFPEEGHRALDQRAILKQPVEYLTPRVPREYENDPRFKDCWTKLAVFGLVRFERIVLLDADMLVVGNMDELMDLPLDDPNSGRKGSRVFAASYACLCNPAKKLHYPSDWYDGIDPLVTTKLILAGYPRTVPTRHSIATLTPLKCRAPSLRVRRCPTVGLSC